MDPCPTRPSSLLAEPGLPGRAGLRVCGLNGWEWLCVGFSLVWSLWATWGLSFSANSNFRWMLQLLNGSPIHAEALFAGILSVSVIVMLVGGITRCDTCVIIALWLAVFVWAFFTLTMARQQPRTTAVPTYALIVALYVGVSRMRASDPRTEES